MDAALLDGEGFELVIVFSGQFGGNSRWCSGVFADEDGSHKRAA